MHRVPSRVAVVAAAITALVAAVLAASPPPPVSATANVTVTRYAGADRYETAALVATRAFGTSDDAVVASGDDFPDALAGAFLAGATGSPVLLTRSASLPQATKDALGALKVRNVVVLGGSTAVSGAVEADLRATPSTNAAGGNLNVARLAGADRYETARAANVATGAANVGLVKGGRTAFLATGERFPDALFASAPAWSAKLPVILTESSRLTPAAADTLRALRVEQVIVLGGDQAVSPGVEAAVNAMGVRTLTRLAGADRDQTAEVLLTYSISVIAGLRSSGVFVARDDDPAGFADALAMGPAAGRLGPFGGLGAGAPDAALPRSTVAELVYLRDTVTDVHIPGGTGAVSTAKENDVKAVATSGGPTGSPTRAFTTSAGGLTIVPFTPASEGGSGQGTLTVTFGGVDTPVRAALFPCSGGYGPDVVSDSGPTRFRDVTGPTGYPPDGKADDIGSSSIGAVRIVAVNGAPVPLTGRTGEFAPASGGTVSVTVLNTQGAGDCAFVAVFADANGDSQLDLSFAPGVYKPPSERFGVSGPVVFASHEAPDGTFAPAPVVWRDTASHVLYLGVQGGYWYVERPGDTPAYAFTGGAGAVTAAQFQDWATPGDVVALTQSDPYRPGGSNRFTLQTDYTATAAGVTTAQGAFDADPGNAPDDVKLAITPSAAAGGDVVRWCAARVSFPANFVALPCTPDASTLTIVDSNPPNGSNHYEVWAVSGTGATSDHWPV